MTTLPALEPSMPPLSLLRRVGEGAVGEVWEVFDARQQRTAALKRITVTGPERLMAMERLAAEVDVVRSLRHPNVMEIWDAGPDWWVGPLYPGGSVARRMETAPLTMLETLAVMDGVLSALDAIHRADVVHRDVGPANVVWGADGAVRLVDFGIAALAGSVCDPEGTPAYMAPEQRSRGSVLTASDLYAAGALLFACLTGGSPLDLHESAASSPRFAGIPAKWVEVIRTATAVDPTRRFPDASSFRTALRSLDATALPASVGDRTPTAEVRVATEPGAPGRLTEQQLEDQGMRRWLEEEAHRRRRTMRRNARLVVAGVLAVVLIGVAIGAQVSLERWVERERLAVSAARAPRTGEWVGVVGEDIVRLFVTESPGRLSIELIRNDVTTDRYEGTRQGTTVVATGPNGRFELVQSGIRLDGRWVGELQEQDVHVVWRGP